MKKSRILAFGLLFVFVAFAFVGCAVYKGNEKTFSQNGVEITATDRFKLVGGEGKDFILMSLTAQIAFTHVGEISQPSLDDYIEDVIDNLPYEVLGGKIQEENGIKFIELRGNEDGSIICLYEVFLVDDGDIWLVSFACEEDIYEEHKPYFKKWAETIKFVD